MEAEAKALVTAVVLLALLLCSSVYSQSTFIVTQSITAATRTIATVINQRVTQTTTCLDCETTPTTTPTTTTTPPPPTTTPTTTPTITTVTIPNFTITVVEEFDAVSELLRGCTAVSPRYNSTLNLYQYYVQGEFAIYFDVNRTGTGTILASKFPAYQIGCRDYYYCGFRAYASFGFGLLDPATPGLMLIIVTGEEEMNFVKYFVGDRAVIRLESDVRDTPSGSAVFWFIHVYTYTSDNQQLIDYRIPIWSWLYVSEQASLSPFPIEIRSPDPGLAIYDCGRMHIPVTASSNPFLNALFSFFRWLYNSLLSLMPEPVKALFSLIGALGSAIMSALTYLVSSDFMTLALALIPFTLFTFIIIMVIEHGGFGVVLAFNALFNFIKRIAEFIIKLVRSVIP